MTWVSKTTSQVQIKSGSVVKATTLPAFLSPGTIPSEKPDDPSLGLRFVETVMTVPHHL